MSLNNILYKINQTLVILLRCLTAEVMKREMNKSKGKVHPVQALRLCTGRTAYRWSRGIALPFHDHGTRRG